MFRPLHWAIIRSHHVMIPNTTGMSQLKINRYQIINTKGTLHGSMEVVQKTSYGHTTY
jgi:hypothetical protein